MSRELVDVIAQGERSLAAADWEAARRSFEAALEQEESAEALDGLARVCFWQGDYTSAIGLQERAFAGFERRDLPLRAGMIADPDGRVRVAGLNVEISAERPA